MPSTPKQTTTIAPVASHPITARGPVMVEFSSLCNLRGINIMMALPLPRGAPERALNGTLHQRLITVPTISASTSPASIAFGIHWLPLEPGLSDGRLAGWLHQAREQGLITVP
jgi:hypothetical protein